MSEQLLGNERVISKLVAENEPLVERVLGKIEQMKKALTGKGDKFSISEKRRIDKALKLYEKAAEAAGKRDLVKRIMAMREKDEETDEHLSENMNGENLDSEAEKGYNYSRKVPPRDEFATLAMQWAYSDKADIGEQKLFYRKGKWVLLEKSDDGFVEICQYTAKQYDFISKEISRHNEELHDRGINERIYRSTLRYENLGSDNPRNNRNDVGQQAGDGRVGGVHQRESDSNRGTDHEAGEHDIGHQIKYSRKNDQDRSTLTKGEAQKQKANYESDKVYTKAEISKMVESLSGLSSIPKRFRTEIVNDIWTAFNSRYSPGQREQHANFLADKIFARMMQESGDTFDNTSQEDIYAMEREIHKALKKIAREGGSPSTFFAQIQLAGFN